MVPAPPARTGRRWRGPGPARGASVSLLCLLLPRWGLRQHPALSLPWERPTSRIICFQRAEPLNSRAGGTRAHGEGPHC